MRPVVIGTLMGMALGCGLPAPDAIAQSHATSVPSAPAPVPAVPPPGLSATTPAPVPNTPPERVAPANRVPGAGPEGQSHAAGPADSTPFSSGPSTLQPNDDRAGPHSREYPASGAASSPNLSR